MSLSKKQLRQIKENSSFKWNALQNKIIQILNFAKSDLEIDRVNRLYQSVVPVVTKEILISNLRLRLRLEIHFLAPLLYYTCWATNQ